MNYRRPIVRLFSVGVGANFGVRRYGDGRRSGDPTISEVYCVRTIGGACQIGTVDDNLVPFFNEGTQFLRGIASMRLDTRDSRARPTIGFLADVSGEYSHGLGDPSSYFRSNGLAEGAINLYRHSHVLVLRFTTSLVMPTSQSPVPFSELVVLGGPDTMRGFKWGRFHDYSSIIASAEYRWPVWMWVDGIAFVDYGGTFGRYYQDISASRMFPDVGGGFRVRTSRRVYVRTQVAYGWPDGWQAYVSLGI
jgi:outer membrane protein assembly factor BamA